MKINRNFVFALAMTVIITFIAGLVWHPLNLLQIGILFLLSYPWQVGDNVYSLWGGFAEYDIYSIICVFQESRKGNARALLAFPPGIQLARNGNATIATGFALTQMSENSSFVFGMILCQMANKRALLGVGFSCWQFAKKEDALNYIGFVMMQSSVEADACQLLGLIGSQNSGKDSVQLVGVILNQEGENGAGQLCGVVILQRSRHNLGQGIGFALIQQGDDVSQWVGITILQQSRGDIKQYVGISVIQAGYDIKQFFGLTLVQTGFSVEQYSGLVGLQKGTHIRERAFSIGMLKKRIEYQYAQKAS